jgi:adenylate cyclase
MASLLPLIGLSVYAAYRTSQAQRLATTYIGPRSGPQVLAGDIRRGSTSRMLAGIMFCDIEGFTSLSEREAPETVVQIINEVFEQVEAQATRHNGEILKFIGDAMLLVFHAGQRTPADVARDIIETTTKSLEAIACSAHPIGIRIGATIGEVVQGNIGTSERLDYTVMGTAVNLASRLEGLCRPLESSALFCSTIATHMPTLRHVGDHAVKGLEEPVAVYRLPEASEVAAP